MCKVLWAHVQNSQDSPRHQDSRRWYCGSMTVTHRTYKDTLLLQAVLWAMSRAHRIHPDTLALAGSILGPWSELTRPTQTHGPLQVVLWAMSRTNRINPDTSTLAGGIVGPCSELTGLTHTHGPLQVALWAMLRTNRTHPHTWTVCLLYTSPSPRDRGISRMPSSA